MARRRKGMSDGTSEVQPVAIPAAEMPRVFHPPISPAHGQKLVALAGNRKVPEADRPRILEAKARYDACVHAMDQLEMEGDALLARLVALLNEYKRYIEIDLIYDSPADFLYR
jgi:hypothetical protein